MTFEQIIDNYIKLRDKKAEVAKRHKEEIAQYTEAMEAIENVVKAALKQQNLTTMSCEIGTAFLTTKQSATTADKSALREHVIANSDFELVDFQPRKEAVEDFIKNNNGSLPPGVNFSQYEDVQIRRK